jgi:5-methylcytosine-specific restriction endonuclease McrA
MGETSIQWTDRTPMVDRGGRRVRYYQRTLPGPSRRERRLRAAEGIGWCSRCEAWIAGVGRRGLCGEHQREVYREHYRRNRDLICQQKVARKRGVAPLPPEGSEALREWFAGACAYCGAPATTWDHIVPVSKGGKTEPGNIVPACLSCNSSKKDSDLDDWLARRSALPSTLLVEVLSLAEARLG